MINRPDLFHAENQLARDVNRGFISADGTMLGRYSPELVLNDRQRGTTILRTIREQLRLSRSFFFSVAFITPGALAMLKQDLLDFDGHGRIVTSNYLNFNAPNTFEDLLHLKDLGIDVEVGLHRSRAFHPKGYVFQRHKSVTALVGSANLTESALTRNHEWNMKVSAGPDSQLAAQLSALVANEFASTSPLSSAWIEAYRKAFDAIKMQARSTSRIDLRTDEEMTDPRITDADRVEVQPNAMQTEALEAIEAVRVAGHDRALVISATGTGMTILSALDVRSASPRRLLFVAHREQILDKAMDEYKRVLGGPSEDYGKLAGTVKQLDRRYVFATVQSLAKPDALRQLSPTDFDYLLIDEVHRAGAASYRRVLDYLKPDFALGMTATPERNDGTDVYELFNYNVAYEIRLDDALEADMLSPFHYFGVPDAVFHDGSTVSDRTELHRLSGAERASHIIDAIDKYSQQGVPTRGLMFCSRKDEAHALSAELNQRSIRGHYLRTTALTGEDSIETRENAVRQLELGELDYLLTVDIFNEGVDIPSINQVIMLRQTQSAIVFVQQLGRGLRKAPDKDYLTVIDFIGNYANNYLIPVALFGDKSLNKESLRKNLNAAEEGGVLPGMSSVRFDEIARERVLRAIADAKMDHLRRLREEIELLQQRLGRLPRLWDFVENESVDPVVLATRLEHFPALVARTLKVPSGLTSAESRALQLLSHEVLPAKRLHEALMLRELLDNREVTEDELRRVVADQELPSELAVLQSAQATFTLEGYNQGDRARYGAPLAKRTQDGSLRLLPHIVEAYKSDSPFSNYVDDILKTATHINRAYLPSRPFTPGMRYSRRDVARLLGWDRSSASTIYGYRTDLASGQCPIFVTLHKEHDVEASVAYEDELIDPSVMRWFTRNRRSLASKEVRAIVENSVDLHVFVKRDDADGTDFFYLGQAQSEDAEETTMANKTGAPLPVVRMLLRFGKPVPRSLYDYFHPTLTA
ncbi:DUF3427 domain-containing protein [Nesterenkonia aurantiaca]|uniref:Superfamily II DNA or RNA helicase n=1 Tax=Nesterenkonia aurantiaca TaxID=1436010 RepID=A0A4R7G6Y2_9MICC|nr:DUF3427 domain-containing protein [Nesterenkonia aurantiaca]TDS87284.1 superfamily II DNA or RNA helicase [Nesterenkonia aurantiaca]